MSVNPTSGPEGVKERLNIVEFLKNDKFRTLYVRALQDIHRRAQYGDWTSAFQIGSIHGLPYTEWARKHPNPHPVAAGYCTHGDALFPTWHRAYMSLYEQTVCDAAIKAAKKFEVDEDEWMQAAKDLRQPYWDWASDLVPPNEVIADKGIKILDYYGRPIEVWNPLFAYQFNPVDPSFKGIPGVATWYSTRRNPDLNGDTDVKGLIARLKAEENVSQIRSKTLKMLNSPADWEKFSNHGTGDPTKDPVHANSLEAVHDEIHGMVGLGHRIPGTDDHVLGHMTIVEVAGFDPIFYLHHTNTDRLLSLWYALHDTWVSPDTARQSTMGIPAGKVDKDTGLEPFYKNESTPWTSAPLTDTSVLGYIYPEFRDLIGGSKDLIRDAISKTVNELYGVPISPKNSSNKALLLLSNFQGLTRDHDVNLKMYDWSIHASFKKFESKDSFAILFYFAKDGGSPDKEGSYIGSVTAFHLANTEGCANCQGKIDLVQEGLVHLNYNLALNIKSFDPKDVYQYLKDGQLTYQLLGGKNLTSLKIRVQGHPLIIPVGEKYSRSDSDLPDIVYDDVVIHPPA